MPAGPGSATAPVVVDVNRAPMTVTLAARSSAPARKNAAASGITSIAAAPTARPAVMASPTAANTRRRGLAAPAATPGRARAASTR